MTTTVTIRNNTTTVSPGTKSVDIVTLGIQGPAGAAGNNGSGQVIDSESAPAGADNGQLWLQTSTQVLSVYTSGIWEPIVYKTELAADNGGLDTNGGYF